MPAISQKRFALTLGGVRGGKSHAGSAISFTELGERKSFFNILNLAFTEGENHTQAPPFHITFFGEWKNSLLYYNDA